MPLCVLIVHWFRNARGVFTPPSRFISSAGRRSQDRPPRLGSGSRRPAVRRRRCGPSSCMCTAPRGLAAARAVARSLGRAHPPFRSCSRRRRATLATPWWGVWGSVAVVVATRHPHASTREPLPPKGYRGWARRSSPLTGVRVVGWQVAVVNHGCRGHRRYLGRRAGPSGIGLSFSTPPPTDFEAPAPPKIK